MTIEQAVQLRAIRTQLEEAGTALGFLADDMDANAPKASRELDCVAVPYIIQALDSIHAAFER